MSKQSSSSIPTTADRARSKRRMESPFSRTDSSSEAVGEEELAEWQSRYSLPSSIVLRVPTLEERASSYIPGKIAVYEAFFDSSLRGTIPVLIAGLYNLFEIAHSQLNPPAWRILIAIQNLGNLEYISLAITHHAPSEGEKDSPGATASCRSLSGDMSGGVTNDPFAAYQEAAKVMSAKKGSSSRSASGDEVMITGSRRSPVVKLEPSPSLPGNRPKSGWHCLAYRRFLRGDPGSSRRSSPGLLVLREEVEVLKRLVSGEKEQRVAHEFEIRDLKEKVKDLEKVAEASSADALAMNQKNQVLEEDIEALKAAVETFKFEMVMAMNRARYKAVVQEEARSKGAPLPTFEDGPAIPPSSDMDVDSSESGDSLVRSGDRSWNPEVSVVGPGGRMRIQGFSLRSGDRIGTLVYLDPEAFEAVLEPGGLDPEIAWLEPGGTVFRLPRKDYYRYLFGFRILPLGSWPLSSSYVVFYFCKKSLTGLEGAGVGFMTQVLG
ncbi:hypothetical protein F2Q68_00020654 [Brassica cretica]|uniref:Uncharacterized protein n=1 Tax=Brassica cretica TaxID=69181 RepID=A0A8S9G4P3_BRACR|nr:hypothetical protein F2Q68_00020654 [Brassica cretica]